LTRIILNNDVALTNNNFPLHTKEKTWALLSACWALQLKILLLELLITNFLPQLHNRIKWKSCQLLYQVEATLGLLIPVSPNCRGPPTLLIWLQIYIQTNHTRSLLSLRAHSKRCLVRKQQGSFVNLQMSCSCIYIYKLKQISQSSKSQPRLNT
jgi:hypothetical protein